MHGYTVIDIIEISVDNWTVLWRIIKFIRAIDRSKKLLNPRVVLSISKYKMNIINTSTINFVHDS